jgi:MFS family permease
VGSFSGVITSAGYGYLRRWFSDWVLFIVIAGAMGIGLAIAAPLHAWLALLGAFLLIGLGTGFKAPVVASVLMAEAPAHVRAAAAGLNFSCVFLGQALGPFVLRLLVGPFGIEGAFLATGATLVAVAAIIAVAGIGKEKHRAGELT